MRTFSGADGVQGEAETEVADHFSLLLVDSLVLEVLSLHLTQVNITNNMELMFWFTKHLDVKLPSFNNCEAIFLNLGCSLKSLNVNKTLGLPESSGKVNRPQRGRIVCI